MEGNSRFSHFFAIAKGADQLDKDILVIEELPGVLEGEELQWHWSPLHQDHPVHRVRAGHMVHKVPPVWGLV